MIVRVSQSRTQSFERSWKTLYRVIAIWMIMRSSMTFPASENAYCC